MEDRPSPPTRHNAGPKAYAGLAGWRQVMRERLTARISKDRQAIFEEMRAKNMGSVCGIISDILAEEDAVRRDAAARGDRHSTDEDGLPLYGRAALERRDSDADDLLSDDERLSLMLYLQDTLYRIGQEEDATREALAEYDHMRAAEEAELADLIATAEALRYPSTTPGTLTVEGSMYTPPSKRTLPRTIPSAASAASELPSVDFLGCGTPSSRERGVSALAPGPTPSVPHTCEGGVDLEDGDIAMEAGGEVRGSDVTCPICKEHTLADYQGLIFCGCGLRLDTSNGLSLSSLQAALDAASQSHRAHCACEPAFRLQERFGVRALYLDCSKCDDLQLIV